MSSAGEGVGSAAVPEEQGPGGHGWPARPPFMASGHFVDLRSHGAPVTAVLRALRTVGHQRRKGVFEDAGQVVFRNPRLACQFPEVGPISRPKRFSRHAELFRPSLHLLHHLRRLSVHSRAVVAAVFRPAERLVERRPKVVLRDALVLGDFVQPLAGVEFRLQVAGRHAEGAGCGIQELLALFLDIGGGPRRRMPAAWASSLFPWVALICMIEVLPP